MNSNLQHKHIKNPMQELLYCIRGRDLDCVLLSSGDEVSLSFVDSVKVVLLKEATNVGLNNESVKILDNNLQQEISNIGISINVLEKHIIDVLLEQGQGCLSFNLNGQLTSKLKGQTLITIDLKTMLNSNFPGLPIALSNFRLEPIKEKELGVLNILRNSSYHAVKIIKKEAQLDRVECEEKLPINRRMIDVMKDAAFQNIEIKQQAGKPVNINRIIKTKL
jgi:hypothetical protein